MSIHINEGPCTSNIRFSRCSNFTKFFIGLSFTFDFVITHSRCGSNCSECQSDPCHRTTTDLGSRTRIGKRSEGSSENSGAACFGRSEKDGSSEDIEGGRNHNSKSES
mmetsp:Transcript_35652/g.70134  ORF Transcript_35652/g.70134 Transcript_35652/m.70134 type:complete len:108 (-) Transcript_35652:232-555(-)